ncbi:MAG: hypothetical protein ACLUKN_01290 [Bacilli bacterium]
MYEISELVGDVLGSDEFIDYDESSSNKVQEIETPPLRPTPSGGGRAC